MIVMVVGGYIVDYGYGGQHSGGHEGYVDSGSYDSDDGSDAGYSEEVDNDNSGDGDGHAVKGGGYNVGIG